MERFAEDVCIALAPIDPGRSFDRLGEQVDREALAIGFDQKAIRQGLATGVELAVRGHVGASAGEHREVPRRRRAFDVAMTHKGYALAQRTAGIAHLGEQAEVAAHDASEAMLALQGEMMLDLTLEWLKCAYEYVRGRSRIVGQRLAPGLTDAFAGFGEIEWPSGFQGIFEIMQHLTDAARLDRFDLEPG